MPYRWLPSDPDAAPAAAAPLARLRLWPHRSLSAEGFVWFVGLTAALISLPLIGVLGSPVLWGLLPFVGLTLWAVWWALRRSSLDGRLTEELALWRDRIEIVRREPAGAERQWQADPHWVRVTLHSEGGPVENYLTLRGGGREVELGAFLSPDEREALHGELVAALARLR